MPYFGSTTLKDVYRDLEDQGTLPVSGKGLLSTLYNRKSDAPYRGNLKLARGHEAKGKLGCFTRKGTGRSLTPSQPSATDQHPGQCSRS